MKNVIGYIRVSTDGQCKEDKFGLEVQREQILEYCEKNDMKVIRWFSDEGESGAKERPGFALLSFISHISASTVLHGFSVSIPDMISWSYLCKSVPPVSVKLYIFA